MKIKINSIGEILALKDDDFSLFVNKGDSSLIPWEEVTFTIPEDFIENISFYTIKDEILTKNIQEIENRKKQLYIFQLRERRSKECFPIINRGELWYDMLSFSQQQELKQWYQDWLNVTQTLQVPEPLDWM